MLFVNALIIIFLIECKTHIFNTKNTCFFLWNIGFGGLGNFPLTLVTTESGITSVEAFFFFYCHTFRTHTYTHTVLF